MVKSSCLRVGWTRIAKVSGSKNSGIGYSIYRYFIYEPKYVLKYYITGDIYTLQFC